MVLIYLGNLLKQTCLCTLNPLGLSPPQLYHWNDSWTIDCRRVAGSVMKGVFGVRLFAQPNLVRSNSSWKRSPVRCTSICITCGPQLAAKCCAVWLFVWSPWILQLLPFLSFSQRLLISLPARTPSGMPAPDSGNDGMRISIRISSERTGLATRLFFGHNPWLSGIYKILLMQFSLRLIAEIDH